MKVKLNGPTVWSWVAGVVLVLAAIPLSSPLGNWALLVTAAGLACCGIATALTVKAAKKGLAEASIFDTPDTNPECFEEGEHDGDW